MKVAAIAKLRGTWPGGWYIKGCPIVRHEGTIVYKPSGFMILLAATIFRRLKFNLSVDPTFSLISVQRMFLTINLFVENLDGMKNVPLYIN